jgi:hypothetical protein
MGVTMTFAQQLVKRHGPDNALRIARTCAIDTKPANYQNVPQGNPNKGIPPLFTFKEFQRLNNFWKNVRKEILDMSIAKHGPMTHTKDV